MLSSPTLSKSFWIPPGTMLMSTRPLEIWWRAAAICANNPRAMKPGRTAMRKRMRLVTAAKAVAVVHVSARGASSANNPLANRVGMSRE